jgi:hypothetical protein
VGQPCRRRRRESVRRLCVLTVAKTTRVEGLPVPGLPVVTPSHQPHPTHKPSPQVRPAQTRAVRASMYTDVAILARKGEKDCASPATVSLCQASSFWRFLSFQIQFEISRLKKRGVPSLCALSTSLIWQRRGSVRHGRYSHAVPASFSSEKSGRMDARHPMLPPTRVMRLTQRAFLCCACCSPPLHPAPHF